jgi:hypothetical protein
MTIYASNGGPSSRGIHADRQRDDSNEYAVRSEPTDRAWRRCARARASGGVLGALAHPIRAAFCLESRLADGKKCPMR